MTRLVLENAVRDKLLAASDSFAELCDESGHVFGTFRAESTKVSTFTADQWAEIHSLFPREELEAVRRSVEPRIPVEDMLRHYGGTP